MLSRNDQYSKKIVDLGLTSVTGEDLDLSHEKLKD